MGTPSPFIAEWRSWYEGKAPVLQFALKFCAFLLLFSLLSLVPIYQRTVSALVIEDAKLSSAILNRMGEGSHVSEGTISSAQFAITVLPMCSAVEYLWFFCSLILAFPARYNRKISGILIGVILLLSLNLFRILSLYYIRVHYARFFDTIHGDLWGIVLVLATVCLSAAWIGWAMQDDRLEANVEA